MTEAFALCTSNYSLTQMLLLLYMTGGEGSNVGKGLIDSAEARAWRGNRTHTTAKSHDPDRRNPSAVSLLS